MTLLELLQLLRKHLKLVIALPVACALAVGIFSFVGMKDSYTATTSMYVLVKADSDKNSNGGNLYSDLNASQMVTNDVSTLLGSDRVINETAKALGLKDLDAFKTSVTSETTSRVITLSVTGPNPSDVAKVADAMAKSASDVAQEVMDVSSVNIIDAAQEPTEPSGPNRKLYVAVGLLAGLFLAVAIVVVADMLNTKVRNQDEIEELLGVPVIGRFPYVRGGGSIVYGK